MLPVAQRERSSKNLQDVHPGLVEAVTLALTLSEVEFIVIEGLRTRATQRRYVRQGASRTMRSRHLRQKDGYAHAVDLAAWVDNQVSWEWEHYERINEAMQEAAARLGLTLVWGGSWESFKDGPHFQIETPVTAHGFWRRCGLALLRLRERISG